MGKFDDVIELVYESLENTYDTVGEFEETTGEYDPDLGYAPEELDPMQQIRFTTDKGVEYLWYAKQSRYTDTDWTIAFGVVGETKPNGNISLDITTNNKGDAMRVFATVIEITNEFVEFGEERIQSINFEAKEENRRNLYVKRLAPRLDGFKVDEVNGEWIWMTRSR